MAIIVNKRRPHMRIAELNCCSTKERVDAGGPAHSAAAVASEGEEEEVGGADAAAA